MFFGRVEQNLARREISRTKAEGDSQPMRHSSVEPLLLVFWQELLPRFFPKGLVQVSKKKSIDAILLLMHLHQLHPSSDTI